MALRCMMCGTSWTSGGKACPFCGGPGTEVAVATGSRAPLVVAPTPAPVAPAPPAPVLPPTPAPAPLPTPPGPAPTLPPEPEPAPEPAPTSPPEPETPPEPPSAPVDLEQRERIRRNLPRYVEMMLVNETLSKAATRALTKHAESLGLETAVAQLLIESAMMKLGAKAGPDKEPDAPALERAEALLREVVGIVDATPAPAAEAPPPDVAPEAAPAAKVTAPAEEMPAAMESPPPAAPEKIESAPPEAPKGLEPAEGPVPVEAPGVVTPKERKPAMKEPRPMPPALAPARSSPRVVRTLASLLAVALAFAAGNLVAAFAPKLATGFDAGTAGLRTRIAEAASTGTLVGITLGAVAILLLLLVWLAGRPGGRGFLVPAIVLALAAAAAGLQPLGHRLTIERLVTALRDEAGQAAQKAAAAEERARQAGLKSDSLQKQTEDANAAVESHAKQLKVAKEELALAVRTAQEQAAAVAERDRKIAGLEQEARDTQKALAEARSESQALRTEVDRLKKSGEALTLEKAVLQSDKETLQLQKGTLQREKETLQKENDALKKEIEELKKKEPGIP